MLQDHTIEPITQGDAGNLEQAEQSHGNRLGGNGGKRAGKYNSPITLKFLP